MSNVDDDHPDANRTGPRGGRGLATLLLLAFALRLGWLWLCPNQPVSDQSVYHQAAIAIAHGDGFVELDGRPHGWWPVGYSAAMAPFYWLLGDSPRSGHVANLLFGVALVAAVFRLALELFGRRAAWLAGLLAAVNPTAVLMTTVLALENLYAPMVVGALAILVGGARAAAPTWRRVAAVGVLLGLAAYVRAPAVLLLVTIPCWALVNGRGWLRGVGYGAAAAALALLVLLPWGLRTKACFGTFQLVSMNGMSNLWMGNHPGTDGGYHELPADVASLTIPERERELGARAIAFIVEQPGQYLQNCLRRAVMTLRSDTIAVGWNETGLAARGLQSLSMPLKLLTSGAFFLIGAAAIWSCWRRRRDLGRADLLLALVLAVLAFPFVAIVGGNRYHLPMAPLLWVLVAAVRRDRLPSTP